MDIPGSGELTRRDALGLGALVAAGALGRNIPAAFPSGGRTLAAQDGGSSPTSLPDIAALAREHGEGEPLTFVDLDALDRNIQQVLSEAGDMGFDVRPSLKSFQNPHLAVYVMEQLPEPRGMVYHLRDLEELLRLDDEGEFIDGMDLMYGYIPTVGELEQYFASNGTEEPPHRMRWMIDDPELLDMFARMARESDRDPPTEVALEFDGGIQRGGIVDPSGLSAAIDILRENRDVIELTALMCYDGQATLDPDDAFRQAVATEAQRRYETFIGQLREEAGDFIDVDGLVRNGPGSSNYQQWDPDGVLTEISPGTAFTFDGYLTEDGFDNEGLVPTLYQAAPVMRIPSTGPRLPFHDVDIPDALVGDNDEVVLKGGAWPSNTGELARLIWPEGLADNALSSGRGNNSSAILAPAGELELGDYALVEPQLAGDGIQYFSELHAIRDGELEAVWPTYERW
jgi:D-serine deaminase-like pyridoxal phosphate-dependent protein